MNVTRLEAPSTKAALKDIARKYGEAAYIISNTRIGGRNVVFFATESANSVAEQPTAEIATTQIPARFLKAVDQTTGVDHAEQVPATNDAAAHIALEQPESPAPANDPTALDHLGRKLGELQDAIAQLSQRLEQGQSGTEQTFETVRRVLETQDTLSKALSAKVDQHAALLTDNLETARQISDRLGRIDVTELPQASPERPATAATSTCKSRARATARSEVGGRQIPQSLRYPVARLLHDVHFILLDESTNTPDALADFCRSLPIATTGPTPLQLHWNDAKPAADLAQQPQVISGPELWQVLATRRDDQGVLVFATIKDFVCNHSYIRASCLSTQHLYTRRLEQFDFVALKRLVGSLDIASLYMEKGPSSRRREEAIRKLGQCGLVFMYPESDTGPREMQQVGRSKIRQGQKPADSSRKAPWSAMQHWPASLTQLMRSVTRGQGWAGRSAG